MKSRQSSVLATIAIFLFFSASFAMAGEDDSYLNPVEGKVPEQAWWENFGDPVLETLIEQGLLANPDLQTAKSRMEQAKAVAWQTLAPVLPQISVEMSGKEADIEQLGANTVNQLEAAGEDVPDSYRSGSAMLVGTLNVDLFGKRIMNHLGSRKDALAAMQDQDTQAAALAVSIAQVYYDILAGRERVKAIKAQIEANKDLLELVRLQYERGDATGLDVLQQKQQLAATATMLPVAEAALETAKQQLAILLGRLPRDQIDLPEKELPEIAGQVPTGRPSDLIQNSPEIKSAAASVKAETQRKNSAIVTFLPTVQIYGQVGDQMTYIVDEERISVWEVGAQLSIPLFQGGSNLANYRQAKAAQKVAQHHYKKASLEAIQKVEGAMIQEKQAGDQLEAYSTQLEAASQALQQSKHRYVLGVTEYQSVLTALNSKQQAELNVIESRVAKINARISLLNSLGGKWTENLMEKKGEEK